MLVKFAEDLYWYSLWKPYRALFFRGYSCNVFAIDQGEEIWLVDVGTDAAWKFKLLLRTMKKDGLDPNKVSKVLVTHAHPDHIAALPSMIEISNADVYIHEKDSAMLENGYDYFWDLQYEKMGDLRKEFYFFKKNTAKRFSNYPMGALPNIKEYHSLYDGENIIGEKHDAIALHTPGHTQGHCSYYFPDIKAFYCGDLIDPGYDHKPPLNFPAVNYDEFYRSIQTIRSLSVDYFCAAHAKQIHRGQDFYNEMVEGVLDNLDFARKRVIELLKANGNMRVKDFSRKFPVEVWQPQEHKSVALSVLKSLMEKGKVTR